MAFQPMPEIELVPLEACFSHRRRGGSSSIMTSSLRDDEEACAKWYVKINVAEQRKGI